MKLNAPRQNFNKTYSPNGVIDIYKKKFIIKNKFTFWKKSKSL
jgi:CMP-N-acetylneuraminic acid synthetase